MIWLILALIVAIVLPIILTVKGELWDFGDGVLVFMFTCFVGVLLSLAIMVLGGGIATASGAPTQSEKVESVEVISLNDNSNTEGTFFLGSGSVNEELVYYYAYESDKGITVGEIDADEVYINYTDKQPRLEKYQTKFKSEFLNWSFAYLGEDSCYYKLYIPEGSIIEEYTIDLE
jgi:hypothetical protein